MNLNKRYFPALILSIFSLLCSCSNFINNKKLSIDGSWRLASNGNQKSEGGFDDDLKQSQELKNGMLINFFPSGRFTQLEGDSIYREGKWSSANKGQLLLHFDDLAQQAYAYRLRMESTNEHLLSLTGKNGVSEYRLAGDGLPTETDDPFHPDNNKWRKRPSHKEDSAQLSNRIANYIKHLALILKAADTRKQEVVYFDFSQGPAKIYQSAIGVYPYGTVPESWKKTFYDDEDARRAHALFGNYISRSHYRGAASGKWLKDDYDILLSIYSDLNNQTHLR